MSAKKDIICCIALAKKFINIEVLTPEIIRTFISKIVIHEKSAKHCKSATQQIDIYFTHIGMLHTVKKSKKERRIEAELSATIRLSCPLHQFHKLLYGNRRIWRVFFFGDPWENVFRCKQRKAEFCLTAEVVILLRKNGKRLQKFV